MIILCFVAIRTPSRSACRCMSPWNFCGLGLSQGSVMAVKQYRTNRNQAYIRHQRQRVIQRKMRIAQSRGWAYKFEGIFAKGKVHCSCWWCTRKTYRLGYSKSDLAKICRCEEQVLAWANYTEKEKDIILQP